MSSILSMPDAGAGGSAIDQMPMVPQNPTFAAPNLGVGGLTRNPQLPQTPLGAYQDSQYTAAAAQLRGDIMRQYNDILSQLGYTDDQGNFVPGTVEIEANKQRGLLNRNIQLADEATTQQAQQAGTLFSGLRATAQARAEFPFQSALADLGVAVPKQLSALYGQAGDLFGQFNTQNNMLLADAAARQSAAIQQAASAQAAADAAARANQPITINWGDYGGGSTGGDTGGTTSPESVGPLGPQAAPLNEGTVGIPASSPYQYGGGPYPAPKPPVAPAPPKGGYIGGPGGGGTTGRITPRR